MLTDQVFAQSPALLAAIETPTSSAPATRALGSEHHAQYASEPPDRSVPCIAVLLCGSSADFAFSAPLTSDYVVCHFVQVGTDNIGLLAGRVKDHHGTRDEGSGATGAHRSRHIPGVSGDQAHVGGLDAEPLSRHVVRLAGGFQPPGHVC